MKCSVATFLSASIIAGCSSYSSAFVVPTLPVRWTAPTSSTPANARSAQTTHLEAGSRRRVVGALSAEPAEEPADKGEDQEPMDLDLEQMFEVFDAADKEVSDAAVGKKADKKPTKDAGDAMGDMLSNFFGGGKK